MFSDNRPGLGLLGMRNLRCQDPDRRYPNLRFLYEATDRGGASMARDAFDDYTIQDLQDIRVAAEGLRWATSPGHEGLGPAGAVSTIDTHLKGVDNQRRFKALATVSYLLARDLSTTPVQIKTAAADRIVERLEKGGLIPDDDSTSGA